MNKELETLSLGEREQQIPPPWPTPLNNQGHSNEVYCLWPWILTYSWKNKEFQPKGLKTNVKILIPGRIKLRRLCCDSPSCLDRCADKVSSFSKAHALPKHPPLQWTSTVRNAQKLNEKILSWGAVFRLAQTQPLARRKKHILYAT